MLSCPGYPKSKTENWTKDSLPNLASSKLLTKKEKKEKLPHETWPFLGNFECMSVAYHHNSMISIWSSCLKINKTVFHSEILFFLKKERAKLPNDSKETGSNFTSILTNITRKLMSMCEEMCFIIPENVLEYC